MKLERLISLFKLSLRICITNFCFYPYCYPLNSGLVYHIEQYQSIDWADNDQDDIPDYFETQGMMCSNGQLIFTDPTNPDCDGDGLLDGQEIVVTYDQKYIQGAGNEGHSISAVYFTYKSNPNNSDSDEDGRTDNMDNNPLVYYPLVDYNPSNAIDYARDYADYNILLTFSHHIYTNADYYLYSTDCANFVSQCLYNGGFEMYGEGDYQGWHSYYDGNNFDISEVWRLAEKQYTYFKNSDYNLYPNEDIVIYPSDFDECGHLTDFLNRYNIKAGDLLYMDFENDGIVDHATFIDDVTSDDIFYSAHTDSRFHRNLSFANDGDTTFYIIRIGEYE